jgi:hypothetical protein
MPSESTRSMIETNRNPFVVRPARAAVLVLAAWMCLGGYLRHPSRYDLERSGWVNADAPRLEQVARRLLSEWGTDLAGFFAIGVASYLAPGTLAAGLSSQARIGIILGSGIAICGLVRGMQLGHFPEPGHLVLPLGAYFFGVWVARAFVRGRRALLWLGAQIAAFVMAVCGTLLLLGWLSVQNEPLAFEPIAARTIGTRELADKLRGKHEGARQARRVRLSDEDINQLVAAGLSRLSPAWKAQLKIVNGQVHARLSSALRARGAPRYLNLQIGGAAQIDEGELSLRGNQFSIGRVSVPLVFLRLISPQVACTVRHDRDLRNLVGSIASLRIENDAIDTVFKPGECSNTFLPALALAYSGNPSMVGPTREHVRQLVEGSGNLPAGEERFAELLRRAFEFARTRSVDEDPIIENRSAMVALAILIGHPKVEMVVGPVLDDRLRAIAGRNLQGVTVRGRADWTKHFFLSAAMVLIACERTSDQVGILKELLDAEEGGSGFSFGDLAANRAGILLARESTFNLNSARAFQRRLAGGFPIDSVFPDVADLPENLTRDQFDSRYGGVHGEEYRKLVEEIDRRLSKCAALRPVEDAPRSADP